MELNVCQRYCKRVCKSCVLFCFRWFKHISDAAEAYKQRDGKHRRPEPSSIPANVDLDTSDTSVHDKTKDNDDSTEGNSSEILPPPRSNGQEDSSSPNSDSTPLPSNESTPQASPAPHTPEPASAAIKLGNVVVAGDGGQRRIEESLRLTTETALIEPSEVLISQRDVLTAEPVLTPLEKLRRKDEDIRRGLLEKQALVAHILHVPQEEFETIADLAGEPAVDKEATEVILAAVDQGIYFIRMLNLRKYVYYYQKQFIIDLF
ncbi:hypothetical protein AAG570_001305 [Ranatra chinensis]|uniref:Uncharacterized protein n=1 Tax=Ranatra chinensis TaxID=642074 RepID=A0ABD0YBH2_9HEMI